MNILITGGAGFVGSHTADKLLKEGHNVRILDNLEKQVHDGILPDYLNKECEFIKGDVRNKDDIKKSLKDIDYVYHFAARVGVGQSMYDVSEYASTNCIGTTNLFEEIIVSNLDVKKVVLASSMSIYGDGAYSCSECSKNYFPKERNEGKFDFHCQKCGEKLVSVPIKEDKMLFPASVYAISKMNQEQYSFLLGKTYDIPVVAFRYWNIYGTRQALSNPYTGVCAIFSSSLLNDNPPTIYEDGNQTRDFVHIKDIVEANYLALNDSIKSDFFNIGSGHTVSIRDVARILAEKMKKDIKPTISNKFRTGDVRHCVPDISKARKILRYDPHYSLDNGIEDLIDWVKLQHSFDKTQEMNKKLEKIGILK